MPVDQENMKRRLEEKRQELQQSIEGLTEATPRVVNSDEASEGPQDFEDAAVDFLETQQEQSIKANQQALLSEVEDALKRIEDGSYGNCVVCGKPISERRLEALPWATRCLQDEERLERRNLGREEVLDRQSW